MSLFFTPYDIAILRVLVIIPWFLLYKRKTSINNNYKAIKYFLVFMSIFIIWNILAILSSNSNYYGRFIYLFFWSFISIFEFFFVLKVLFISLNPTKNHNEVFSIIMSIFAVPVILAAILSYANRSYNPINSTDFYNIILLFIGTLLVNYKLLSQESFIENIESFFIFSGLTLYFGLHILASNIISFNFIKNWNFGQYATLISLVYWLGSTFVIWKIRSKHLF